jgi:hypothetical protein
VNADRLWVLSMVGAVVFFTAAAATAHGADHWGWLGLILLTTGIMATRRPRP